MSFRVMRHDCRTSAHDLQPAETSPMLRRYEREEHALGEHAPQHALSAACRQLLHPVNWIAKTESTTANLHADESKQALDRLVQCTPLPLSCFMCKQERSAAARAPALAAVSCASRSAALKRERQHLQHVAASAAQAAAHRDTASMLLPSNSSWSLTSGSFATLTPSHIGICLTIFSPRKLRILSSTPPFSALALIGKCAYTRRILYLRGVRAGDAACAGAHEVEGLHNCARWQRCAIAHVHARQQVDSCKLQLH